MRQRRALAGVWLAGLLLVSACGPAGSSSPASADATDATGAPATATASEAAAPDGIARIQLADEVDPTTAARDEVTLVGEVRDDAGIAALLADRGADGAATFATLDALTADAALEALGPVATLVESGEIPTTSATDPLSGQVASVGGDAAPPARLVTPPAIDISLFAETGFTTSAFLGMTVDLVKRAGESRNGTLPHQTTREQIADGLRQSVDVNMTVTVATGGGRVRVEIAMSATDRIFDAATGSFVALYTSTSTGSFDVDACPDRQGVAHGTYSFATKHELNDVAAGAATRSAAARSVEAPFTLINGDDAHLQRIEAELDLKADARGPGSQSGGASTGAFDWAASQLVRVVMPAGGATTVSGPAAATVTGSGGERSRGAMLLTSSIAQLFIGQVGKEAERFWRSGKCIDLVPSRDTGSVDEGEQIELTVEAKEAFAGGSIEQPIVATFGGKTSLDPSGQPVDAPATFTFVAGDEQGDRGTIDLRQTSNRGIGTRQVVYTVASDALEAEVRASASSNAGGSTYETEVILEPIALSAQPDGTFQGSGPATWETLWHPAIPGCPPKTYRGTFQAQVTARLDPTDPEAAFVTVIYLSGDVGTAEVVDCNGYPTPYLGGQGLTAWIPLATGRDVRIGEPATFELEIPGGSTSATIRLSRPAT